MKKLAIEKGWEDCYNRGWRSKCYCVGGAFLHRGMGDCQSPMSCLIICLVAVIIPRFPRIDKSFLWGVKIISVGKRTPQSRFACQLPFQGSLFVCCTSKASPERGGGPLAVERFLDGIISPSTNQ